MLPGFEFIPIISSDSEFNDHEYDHDTMQIDNNNSPSHQHQRDCGGSGSNGMDSESVSGESTASNSSRSPPATTTTTGGKLRDGKPSGTGGGRRRRCGGKGVGGEGRSNSRGPIKPVQRNAANARERARMRVLSKAFSKLKTSLPWVPPDTKLSKLDTLRLASSYISHLKRLLDEEPLDMDGRLIHPLNLVRTIHFVFYLKFLLLCK